MGQNSVTAAPRAETSSNGEDDLTVAFRREIANAPADRPLPTTRAFGKRFGVANTTAFRILQKLTREGEIWQHPTSGRYYSATGRALLDRPKPLACLIRRLELASEQYREVLEGISVGCGALQRTMLLWHDELLVNHPDPHDAPLFAPVAQQCAILNNFLKWHSGPVGGFVFDQVWSDECLRMYAAKLDRAVVLFRSCALDGFSNVRADFRSGALKALSHLLGRGFEQIVPVAPFTGDPAVGEFLRALATAAEETGCSSRLTNVQTVSTNRERAALVDRFRRGTKRIALVCPEDNAALFLTEAVRQAALSCPGRIGVLSVMGTDVATEAEISCLRYDFRELGRLAVEAVGKPGLSQYVLEPQLVSGKTT